MCEVWELERARGGCRQERVERACIDTGQSSRLIVAGVTAIKQSLSLPKAVVVLGLDVRDHVCDVVREECREAVEVPSRSM